MYLYDIWRMCTIYCDELFADLSCLFAFAEDEVEYRAFADIQ